jgi:hypothetical protein
MQARDARAKRGLLQQQRELARRRAARQPARPQVRDECVDVAGVAVQVPRDDREIRRAWEGGDELAGWMTTRNAQCKMQDANRESACCDVNVERPQATAVFRAADASLDAERSSVVAV